MSQLRLAVVLGAAGILGGWLAASALGGRALPPAPHGVSAPLTDAEREVITAGAPFQELRERLQQPRVPRPPRRNPFRFRAASPPGHTPPGHMGTPLSAVPAEAAAAPVAEPLPVLVGLASDTKAGTVVRTAIISASGELHLLKAGEEFASRYRVTRIGEDAVELLDLVTNQAVTLTMKAR